MSGNRSAWITPCGRSRGQCLFEHAQFRLDDRRAGRAARRRRASAACSNSGRQPATESALRRLPEKSAPARCMRASASPTAAQWPASGRRIHMPSRKVTIAAGRPHSAPSVLAVAVLHRLRAGEAARRQMLHQRRGRTAGRRPRRASRRASGCNGRRWCGRGNWSSRRPRRCPCRTAARPGRSPREIVPGLRRRRRCRRPCA